MPYGIYHLQQLQDLNWLLQLEMHVQMYPNEGFALILLAHDDPLSSPAYPVITYTHPTVGN